VAFLLPRSIFVHIPKTGGQWVTKALGNSGLVVQSIGPIHSTLDEVNDDPAVRERHSVFAMVRHPLLWYQSMWAHRMDEDWAPIDEVEWFSHHWIGLWSEFTKECRATRFDEFVQRCTSWYSDGFVSMLYDSYTAGCTYVGRSERLEDDLIGALDAAGEVYDGLAIRGTSPKNVRAGRPHRRVACVYTEKLANLVMRVEQRAIARFGYHTIPARVFAAP
jgi:hypothetical protein